MKIKTFTGQAANQYKKELARLRIEVFRDYPYLYDGDLVYEEAYLETFMQADDAIIVVAFDQDRVVGVSTALPLQEEPEEVQRPWLAAGYNSAKIFYLSESVLLKSYRGRGVGLRFFEERENWARNLQYEIATFCGVVRPEDHPQRPIDFVPLDTFWRKRGYERKADFTCTMSWKEIHETAESEKALQFWWKPLR